MPTGQRVSGFYVTRNLRRHTNTHLTTAHFRQTDRPVPAIRFIVLTFFPRANFCNGPRQIAVPLQRVHTQIKVGIKNKHRVDRFLI